MVVKAYHLRDTVSENEKLRIIYFHYALVTGEIDKSLDILELWRKTYASQIPAIINLSDLLERTGQFEKSIAVIREALRRDSNDALILLNLALPLLKLNRFAEAKEIIRMAFEKNFDGYYFHDLLYTIAFIENDTAEMTKQMAWFGGGNNEFIALNLQTGTAAFRGEWRKAQDFSRRAIDLANRSGAKEVAAQLAANQALKIVFWSSGTGLPKGEDKQLKAVLKTQTNNALKLERNRKVITFAALALACAGLTAEANSLIDELKNERPKDTLLNELWLPTIRAASELQNNRAKEAIEELEITKRFEHAGEFYPQYIRALAFLKLNKSKQAVAEFDKILNHRGEASLSSIYPLAQLGKSRATKDKSEYAKFFELWKDADKDMPALAEAKNEYEDLSK
ncbi:MAG: hypothetical protein ABI891_11585 [Acidobacteriota bacterium]